MYTDSLKLETYVYIKKKICDLKNPKLGIFARRKVLEICIYYRCAK